MPTHDSVHVYIVTLVGKLSGSAADLKFTLIDHLAYKYKNQLHGLFDEHKGVASR